MKNSTLKLIIFVVVYLFSFIVACNAQIVKDTINSTTVCTNSNTTNLHIFVPSNAKVIIKPTQGTRIIIDKNISIEGAISTTLCNYLKNSTRYNLTRTVTDNGILLVLNDLKPISINGVIPYEKLEYTIFVPSNITKVTINDAF